MFEMNSSRRLFLTCLVVLLLTGTPVGSFTLLSQPSSRCDSRLGASSPETSRRDFLAPAVALPVLLASSPLPAHASKPPPEPATPENVNAAFREIEFELRDPQGGAQVMQRFLDNRDYEGLLEFTKTYDLELRKKKWGRCKAFLNSAEKEVATLTGNSLTFDLIGMNRNSRAGQENPEKVQKYLNELKTDLQNMVDMKKTIVFDQEGSFAQYMSEIKGN